jgi:hypothetical protein
MTTLLVTFCLAWLVHGIAKEKSTNCDVVLRTTRLGNNTSSRCKAQKFFGVVLAAKEKTARGDKNRL